MVEILFWFLCFLFEVFFEFFLQLLLELLFAGLDKALQLSTHIFSTIGKTAYCIGFGIVLGYGTTFFIAGPVLPRSVGYFFSLGLVPILVAILISARTRHSAIEKGHRTDFENFLYALLFALSFSWVRFFCLR